MVLRNWFCLTFCLTNSLKLCRRPFISNLLKEELRLCILCWLPALEHRIAMLRHHFPRGFALRSRLALPIRCSLSMPAMPQTDIGLGIPDALPEWKKMPTMEDCVGETPLVRLQRMVPRDSKSMVLCKLEGLNCFALFLKDLPDSLNRLYIQIFKASLLFQRKTVKNLVRGSSRKLQFATCCRGHATTHSRHQAQRVNFMSKWPRE